MIKVVKYITGEMRMSEKEAYVKLDKVSKIYGTKEVKIVAVDEISFEIAKGEFVVIVGPSDAGQHGKNIFYKRWRGCE